MKAIIYENHGCLDNLTVADVPKPTPSKGEALISVRAVALNGFDPMILKGIPGIKTPMPMVPGGDVSGEIVAFGEDTKGEGLEIGDRVLLNPLIITKGVLGETMPGGAREFMTFPIENLIKIPDGVSYEQAAALPIAYGTAHKMMLIRAGVKKGDKVLILGATGGVGVCCLQLSKLYGAEVAACTSSKTKGKQLRELGADHVIVTTDYADFVKEAHRIFGRPRVFDDGGGANIVINYNGGDSWVPSLKTACRGGKIITCGATNGYAPNTDLRYVWSLELNILGSNGWNGNAGLEDLLNMVAARKIEPAIHSVRPVEELAASLQDMIDRKVFGKAVLTV